MRKIQRRFTVHSGVWALADKGRHTDIIQAFIFNMPFLSVSVRESNTYCELLWRNKFSMDGSTCTERKLNIPKWMAKWITRMCKSCLYKRRYSISHAGRMWCVDELLSGKYHGKLVAKVDLTTPHDPFYPPNWIENDVTGNSNYYGHVLVKACRT